MVELDFSFPVIRGIDATRRSHQKRIDKLIGNNGVLFLTEYSDDDLFEVIWCKNMSLFTYYKNDHWMGQKGVRAIKMLVNNYVRVMIGNYLVSIDKPISWDTAYYLRHQTEVAKKMEAVSRCLYEELA